MLDKLKDCPCTGKSSSNFSAAWILLTLHKEQGAHGYALAGIISDRLESVGFGMNITGLYRQLAALEKRGMLTSTVDSAGRGPSRKKYFLTDSGLNCLQNWMGTMRKQAMLIETFFEQAAEIFPDSPS